VADWQVGDLALCVKDGVHTRAGCPYTVCTLAVGRNGLVLGLRELWHIEHHRISKSLAARFIKVTPQSEDAFDREVIDHMAGQEVGA